MAGVANDGRTDAVAQAGASDVASKAESRVIKDSKSAAKHNTSSVFAKKKRSSSWPSCNNGSSSRPPDQSVMQQSSTFVDSDASGKSRTRTYSGPPSRRAVTSPSASISCASSPRDSASCASLNAPSCSEETHRCLDCATVLSLWCNACKQEFEFYD